MRHDTEDRELRVGRHVIMGAIEAVLKAHREEACNGAEAHSNGTACYAPWLDLEIDRSAGQDCTLRVSQGAITGRGPEGDHQKLTEDSKLRRPCHG